MPRNFLAKAISRFLATLLLIAVSLGQATAQSASPKYPPTVVFMTDFGTVDDAVSICKGVMFSVAPDLRVVDLTHQVTPFSILDGARFLYGATPYYPASVVFVGVVDPGVGSARKPIIVKTKRGQYFVVPDNGLITLVGDRDGVEGAHEISNPAWMIGSALSSTFHGRDIFSPAAAHLARGDDWTQAGPEMDASKLVRLDVAAAKLDEHGLTGEVIATDGPFGNLITNIPADDFLKLGYARGQVVHIKLGNRELDIPFVKTFSAVPMKKPLLYIDSEGRLAAAVNQDSFAAIYGIKPPVGLFIARAK